jgi:hypothetical protein
MTQMAARAVTDRVSAPMIAGAIPLIDVAGHLGGDAESSRQAEDTTALGIRECRLLLPVGPRRTAIADRSDLRGGGPVPRPADGRETRTEGQ